MPRVATDHGTYNAYLRCRKRPEGACALCVDAKDRRSARVSTSAKARVARQAGGTPPDEEKPPTPTPTTAEGHVSRLEVLKDLLEAQRQLMPALRRSDPAKAYLLMREQRETVREIAELQGNGQVKGVTLADQLADARARRLAATEAS
jgi:hypothetical protein